jgi:peptidylprolyl isomerase
MVLGFPVPTIKGLRVRLSRLRFVSAAVIPLVFLAACSSAKSEAKPNPLDVVTVGGTAKAPTLVFKTKPLSVNATTTKVVTPGKGAKLTQANAVMSNYVVVNGKDGKVLESTFGKQAVGMDLSAASLLPGLKKGLTGQRVGSRMLVAIPPVDAFGAKGSPQVGLGPKDTAVFLLDLVSASSPLKSAIGDPVKPRAGLPTVKVDAKGIPVITVPKTQPPTKLVVQPLIKGKGPVVKAGQQLTAAYTGVIFRTGKVFDSSYTSGEPLRRPVGTGQLVPGFDKGLVGQTVGSRILLVLPPAEGYGAKGSPPIIGAKDTLVFVVDILAII